MNRFNRSFRDDPILDGSDWIEAVLVPGVEVLAVVKYDPDTTPGEAEDAESIAAWKRDEWRYCDIVLKIRVNGVCIDDGFAYLGGVDARDGEYITERANDLLSDNEDEILFIVGTFARKVARIGKVLREMGKA